MILGSERRIPGYHEYQARVPSAWVGGGGGSEGGVVFAVPTYRYTNCMSSNAQWIPVFVYNFDSLVGAATGSRSGRVKTAMVQWIQGAMKMRFQGANIVEVLHWGRGGSRDARSPPPRSGPWIRPAQ